MADWRSVRRFEPLSVWIEPLSSLIAEKNVNRTPIRTYSSRHIFDILSSMPNPGKPYPLEGLFQALADRTRLRLLYLMAKQEVCVCYFVEVLQVPQPKISRHLAYLRRAGLVAARREGKWMHYRLLQPGDPYAAGVLQTTLHALQRNKSMQRDLVLLQKACCGVSGLVNQAAMAERAPRKPA